MKRPHEVTRSPEEGEALIERIERETWTADDRSLVVQVLRMYFWVLCALQEAKRSLTRLRTMLFGEKPKRRTTSPSGEAPVDQGNEGGAGRAVSSAVVVRPESATGTRARAGMRGSKARMRRRRGERDEAS